MTLPNSFERQIATAYTPALTAGTANDAEHPIFLAREKCVIYRVYAVPQAAITANGTNYFTWNVRNKDTSGSGTTQVGAGRAFSSGNATAFAEEILANLESNVLILAAGSVLGLHRLSNNATGLATPQSLVVVEYARVGDSWQL